MKSLKYVPYIPSFMPLSAKVKNRIEVVFFEGEIIPPIITSYLLSSGRISPNDITLGEEN
jgi:hypothetical protein